MRGNWVYRWVTVGCNVDWRVSKMERWESRRERLVSNWGWLGCSWERLENKRERWGNRKERWGSNWVRWVYS